MTVKSHKKHEHSKIFYTDDVKSLSNASGRPWECVASILALLTYKQSQESRFDLDVWRTPKRHTFVGLNGLESTSEHYPRSRNLRIHVLVVVSNF